MTALLQIAGLSVRFGGLTAVSDVSLTVARGEIHALVGPNGAGKSTVVNCISGFQSPSAGEVRLDGALLPKMNPVAISRLGVARTFQTPQLFGRLTVAQNVRVASRRNRPQLSDVDLIQLVGLADFYGVLGEGLAYGQQRLLEVARALATAPQLLLLDEPAAGLAAEDLDRLAKLLRRIAADFELGILLIEHNVGLVKRLSNRVTVMHHGLVIATGEPEAVFADPVVVEAYLGHGAASGTA